MSRLLMLSLTVLSLCVGAYARNDRDEVVSIRVKAANKQVRNEITALGLAIDAVFSDSVGIIGTRDDVKRLKAAGFKLEVTTLPARRSTGRGFPKADAIY